MECPSVWLFTRLLSLFGTGVHIWLLKHRLEKCFRNYEYVSLLLMTWAQFPILELKLHGISVLLNKHIPRHRHLHIHIIFTNKYLKHIRIFTLRQNQVDKSVSSTLQELSLKNKPVSNTYHTTHVCQSKLAVVSVEFLISYISFSIRSESNWNIGHLFFLKPCQTFLSSHLRISIPNILDV